MWRFFARHNIDIIGDVPRHNLSGGSGRVLVDSSFCKLDIHPLEEYNVRFFGDVVFVSRLQLNDVMRKPQKKNYVFQQLEDKLMLLVTGPSQQQLHYTQLLFDAFSNTQVMPFWLCCFLT